MPNYIAGVWEYWKHWSVGVMEYCVITGNRNSRDPVRYWILEYGSIGILETHFSLKFSFRPTPHFSIIPIFQVHSAPRVRNLRTLGSFDSASSFLGSPLAVIVLLSTSRKTELFPIAKMLASSWVTMTIVVPRLSRSSRIRSSKSRALTGSRPAEGSSKKRMSGSRAMARARPALFFIPPLISEG